MNNLSVFLVVIVVVLIIANICYTESFDQMSGGRCLSCEGRSFGGCMNCFNCGFVSKDGQSGKCVNGNIFGASDINNRRGKYRWFHNDPFVRYYKKKGL